MELIKTTARKRFNLKTWEFASLRATLQRKHSGGDDSSHMIDVEVSFPVLRVKANHEGVDVRVVLFINAASMVCQSPTAEVLTPVEAQLKEIEDAKHQPEDSQTPTKPGKGKDKAKGGTWSTKHLLQ